MLWSKIFRVIIAQYNLFSLLFFFDYFYFVFLTFFGLFFPSFIIESNYFAKASVFDMLPVCFFPLIKIFDWEFFNFFDLFESFLNVLVSFLSYFLSLAKLIKLFKGFFTLSVRFFYDLLGATYLLVLEDALLDKY